MTSEPEKLLPVIQADREAAFRYWCHTGSIAADNNRAVEWRSKLNHGSMDGREVVQAFARHRLSSPVSGTDMVSREVALQSCRDARAHAEKHYGVPEGVGADMAMRRIAALSASPTPPIPVIAEAGERDHGLGSNATVIEDEADGFDPIAMLVGSGNVYLQQGAAQIFAGFKQAEVIRATLTAKTEKAE